MQLAVLIIIMIQLATAMGSCKCHQGIKCGWYCAAVWDVM